MRVHWLQHVAFEELGSIAPFLRGRGHEVSVTRLYASSGRTGETLTADAPTDAQQNA